MTSRKQLFKNLTCLSFCCVMLFIATIFVSETYYNSLINSQIQQMSILKSIHFEDWAYMQAPSTIIHKFQAYSYDKDGNPSLNNQSLKYQYLYQYSSISFTQGNTGNIRYLNNWKRLPIQQQNNNAETIKVFNVDAEKVYNYDYFAPQTRRFALSFNILFDMLSKDFLNNFYGYYMYEFLFQYQQMVQTRIFDPLNIKPEQGKIIYTHPVYGLNTPLSIASWLGLGEEIKNKTYYFDKFYIGIKNQLGLSQSQILYIAGEKSTLQNLLNAIKATIRYKLEVEQFNCDSEDECSKQQLVASQIALGFLTKQTIFPTTNINKLVNQLNTTIYDSIQYSDFCQKNKDLECLDNTGAISFFKGNYLSNYTQVDYIFKNFENPQGIQSKYDIANGTGLSIIKYVKHLNENVFSLPASSENNQQPSDTKLDIQAFKRSFTNYNHIQPILDNFKSLLYLELHTRAFFKYFINSTNSTASPKCEDYYTGVFDQYKGDCKYVPLNLSNSLSSVRTYIKAYLGVDSSQIIKYSSMKPDVLFEFLHNQQTSKFAKQMKQLSIDLKQNYKCTYLCNSFQLMVKQWTDGSILNNLPIKYFTSKNDSILKWDQANVLKGVQPQLFKFNIKISKDFNPGYLLNNIFGIYSIWNLMKVYNNPQVQTYKGLLNADLLYYIQTLVLEVDFNGIYIDKKPSDFFNGYDSAIINQKKALNDSLGGASWLDSKMSVIKLENKPTKFNYINSGIYDSDKLRSLSLIEDSLYSSSQYQIFKSKYDDLKATFKSDKKVKGTNLLGFQTKIQQFDSIQGYFDMIYQSQALSYKQTINWKNLQNQQIQAFKFALQKTTEFSVSTEQLSNRTVELNSDTYFIVEPETGLTLQMYIRFTVYSKPFYLDYIQRSNAKKLPLYQGEVFYVNSNTNKIAQINENKSSLSLFFLLGIILSSISIVSFVVMLVLYKRASKSQRPRQQNQSLITGPGNSVSEA